MHRYYIIADIGFDVQNFPFNTDTPYLNKFLGTDAEQVLIEYVKSDDDRYKMEVATEIGVTVKEGYYGDLTSAEAGSVGGNMVKKMIKRQEEQMAQGN